VYSPRMTCDTIFFRMSCAAFNQDLSGFTQGGPHGFDVWDTDPVRRVEEFPIGGGVRLVQRHLRSTLYAIVGPGVNPEWPSDKVILYDGHTHEARGVLSFPTAVHAVQLTDDHILVALTTCVWTCNWRGERLYSLPTAPNPSGILVVSHRLKVPAYAAPAAKPGTVMVVDLAIGKAVCTIAAHQSPLRAVALTADSKVVATMSERGTVVYIWDAERGVQLNKLQRGLTPCSVYCLAFSHCGQRLAMVSSHGTVHVFSVTSAAPAPDPDSADSPKADGAPLIANRRSYGASLAWYLPLPTYFSAQWSSSWYYLPAPFVGVPAVLGFFQTGRRPWLMVVVAGKGVIKLGLDAKQGGGMRLESLVEMPPAASGSAIRPCAKSPTPDVMEPWDEAEEEPDPGTRTLHFAFPSLPNGDAAHPP